MTLDSINQNDRLYVIRCGAGCTCLGFNMADAIAKAVSLWLASPEIGPRHDPGTAEHYADYESIMAAGAEHAAKTGKQCDAELTHELRGLEGKRVEVVDRYGHRRRFWVGDWSELADDLLTPRAKGFGSYSIYRGDDGLIYGT